MEKKKVTKKPENKTKKTTKVAVKKVTAKTTSKSTKKKKGFTLIELLAVIIILGILMIIAIPSVTKYISDSRKSAYVDSAKEIVAGTRNIVNEGKLGMYDTDTTYYIPAKYVNTENSLKSPYGEFTDTSAYVGVIYDGTGYKYYWISADDAGQGIDEIIAYDKLDEDYIKSDLNPNDILDTVETTGIGSRSNIKILSMEGTWRSIVLSDTSNNVSEDGEKSLSSAIATCPGCKFTYLENSPDVSSPLIYTTWNTAFDTGLPPTVIDFELKDDYHDVIAETGKNYFLGFVLNNENLVTNAYACGVKNGSAFCIEGVAYTDTQGRNKNKEILQRYWNTCINDYTYEGKYYCIPENSGELFGEDYYGEAEIGVLEGYQMCRVQDNGIAYCNDYPSDWYFE